jgi:hypothetical protein
LIHPFDGPPALSHSLKAFRQSTDLVFKSCRDGVTLSVVGPTHEQLMCHGKIVIEQYSFLLHAEEK